MKITQHLVVDSNGFIANCPIQDLGEQIYTIDEVLTEIRDKDTRKRMKVLPYQLMVKQPHAEHIKTITEFSKKTGDYQSLSAIDIKIMALVFQLESENMSGTSHLNQEPRSSKIKWESSRRLISNPASIAGFYFPKKKTMKNAIEEQPAHEEEAAHTKDGTTLEICGEEDELDDGDDQYNDADGDDQYNDADGEDSNDPGGEDSNDTDDEDGSGWITPSNIQAVKLSMGEKASPIAAEAVKVACLTTDFAMQNVLLQMNLNVISTSGMIIRRVKSFVFWCTACNFVTKLTTRRFCPRCGNLTLRKIAMSINDDGSIRCYVSNRRPMTARGTRFSTPTPRGGKYARNPVTVEDQRLPHQKVSKVSLRRNNILNADYIKSDSPFSCNDVHSKSAQIGFRRNQPNTFLKRNPNESKRGGRKK